MIQAVILAGGKGTRLRPITYRIPKPMVPIDGKPFLQHLSELIRSFGIRRTLLLVGYLGSQIEEYFGDGGDFGLEISYSHEDTPLGTGGALKNAEDELEDEFLLLNGDTYLPIDYRGLIRHFRAYDKICTMVGFSNQEGIVANNLLVSDSGQVKTYNKRNPLGMTHVDAGAIVLKREVLSYIPRARICSIEEEVFPELIKVEEMYAYTTNQRFYDMGSFEELELVKRILR